MAGLAGGHGGMDAEGARFVGGGGDDAALVGRRADDDRSAAVFGMVALFDGGIKRVHVHVEEDAGRGRDCRHGGLRGHQMTGSLASVFSGRERRGRGTRGGCWRGWKGMQGR